MNRLAFRVWDKERAMMVGPTAFIFDDANGVDAVEYFVVTHEDGTGREVTIEPEGYGIVVMQATGAVQDDGNAIFEGDIVAYNRYRYHAGWYSEGENIPNGSGIGVIEWDGMGFHIRTGNYGTAYGGPGVPVYESDNLAITLVLGNVYENPDLIPATIKTGTLKGGR